MVKIDRLRDDANKRILKCQEGKNIWYRLWCIEIQKYYVFFYEVRNGRRIIGKNKIKEILNILL